MAWICIDIWITWNDGWSIYGRMNKMYGSMDCYILDECMDKQIISRLLFAALNTSSSCSLPIPAGMPLKSTWFPFR